MEQKKSFPLYAMVVVAVLTLVLAVTVALGVGIVRTFISEADEPNVQTAEAGYPATARAG